MFRPLSTQIVGSYVKPAWLIRHDRLLKLDGSAWRLKGDQLREAQDDAVLLAIREQESAGLDVVTDGEVRRTGYDRYFYARFGGVNAQDFARDGEGLARDDLKVERDPAKARRARLAKRKAPRIEGPLTWTGPISVDDLTFAKRHAARPVKATVVGPITAYDRMQDSHYGSPQAAIHALAGVINSELRALEAAGADLLQIDEPVLHASFTAVRDYAQDAIEAAVAGLSTPVMLHVCYGYAHNSLSKQANDIYADVLGLVAACRGIAGISLEYAQPDHTPDLLASASDKHVLLGVVNLGINATEAPETVAQRLRGALRYVAPERLHASTDCGMWHLGRDAAAARLRAIVDGAALVRRDLGLADAA